MLGQGRDPQAPAQHADEPPGPDPTSVPAEPSTAAESSAPAEPSAAEPRPAAEPSVPPEPGVAEPSTAARPALTVLVTDAPTQSVREQWDRLVASIPGSDVTQLSAWARIRARHGFAPVYLLVRHGAEIVAGAQLLHRRVPLLGAVAYVPGGPVLPPGLEHRADVRDLLAGELATLGREYFRWVACQPGDGAEDAGLALRHRGFRASAAPLAAASSARVDLAVSEQELRANLSRTLQEWTRRWAREGVTVRVGDHRDVPLLARLMAGTGEHQGFSPVDAGYTTTMYRELAAAGNAVLLVGEVDGVPAAAELYTLCGGVVRARLTGLDQAGPAAGRRLGAAVRWEAMRWAWARNYRWFDLGGLCEGAARSLLGGTEEQARELPREEACSFGGSVIGHPVSLETIRPAWLRWAYERAMASERGRALVQTMRRWVCVGR